LTIDQVLCVIKSSGAIRKRMKLKLGIRIKLFFWYFVLVSIFYGTIFVLFIHIRQIMRISENIIDRNYAISSASKKMIESLLSMEENEKKFILLKKKEYKNYFSAARKDYEWNLNHVLELESLGNKAASPWKELHESYRLQFASVGIDAAGDEPPETPWISEQVIDDWIQRISKARSDNEQNVELEMKGLNLRGQLAVRLGIRDIDSGRPAGQQVSDSHDASATQRAPQRDPIDFQGRFERAHPHPCKR